MSFLRAKFIRAFPANEVEVWVEVCLFTYGLLTLVHAAENKTLILSLRKAICPAPWSKQPTFPGF